MIKAKISEMIQSAVEGETSCCEAHATLKELETMIKAGLKVVRSGALDEAREFVKDERYYGGVWQIRSSATLLNYDEDETYTDLAEQASARKKLLNAAWKHKNEGHGFFVTEDSEVIPVLSVKTPGSEAPIFKATQAKAKENDGKTDMAF